MSTIDPDVGEDEADRAEERLAGAIHELHQRSEKIAEEIHQITRPPRHVVIGALVGAVVVGGLFFALRARRARGRRPGRLGQRIGREVGNEIASRVLATAASVVAARVTEDVLLPLVRERLAPTAERRGRRERPA